MVLVSFFVFKASSINNKMHVSQTCWLRFITHFQVLHVSFFTVTHTYLLAFFTPSPAPPHQFLSSILLVINIFTPSLLAIFGLFPPRFVCMWSFFCHFISFDSSDSFHFSNLSLFSGWQDALHISWSISNSCVFNTEFQTL